MKKPVPVAVGFAGEVELLELEPLVSFRGTKAAERRCASAIWSGVIHPSTAFSNVLEYSNRADARLSYLYAST
jgi:hypothetical protein